MMKKAPQGCKEQWLPKPKKKRKKRKKTVSEGTCFEPDAKAGDMTTDLSNRYFR